MSMEKSQSLRLSTGIQVFCLEVPRNRSPAETGSPGSKPHSRRTRAGDEASRTEEMYYFSPVSYDIIIELNP